MTAAAVATMSCTTIKIWRVVSLGILTLIFPRPIGGSAPIPYRCLRAGATRKRVGRLSSVRTGSSGAYAPEGLIDRGDNLTGRKLIQATAKTFEMVFAAKSPARQARQRVLHHPDI